MKPHPRIRPPLKTVKWGGLALGVPLAALWIGSFWWRVPIMARASGDCAWVDGGKLIVLCRVQPPPGAAVATFDPDELERAWGEGFSPWRFGGTVVMSLTLGQGSTFARQGSSFTRQGSNVIVQGSRVTARVSSTPLWLFVAPPLLAGLAVCGNEVAAPYLARRRRRTGACPACGYDLSGLAAAPPVVCPECGGGGAGEAGAAA